MDDQSDAHIRADPHFEELRARQIRFYDTSASMVPLITPKAHALERHDATTIADLMESDDFSSLFEYEDEDDIYGNPIEAKSEDNTF